MSKNLDHLKEEMEKNLNKDNNIDLQSISNNVGKRFKAEKKDLVTSYLYNNQHLVFQLKLNFYLWLFLENSH